MTAIDRLISDLDPADLVVVSRALERVRGNVGLAPEGHAVRATVAALQIDVALVDEAAHPGIALGRSAHCRCAKGQYLLSELIR